MIINMLISVIIPTYRYGDYFWDCLKSLNNQNLDASKFEIIIVLNGEKEPYWSSIVSYFRNDNISVNVKLLYSEKPNVSDARNLGLDNARGEYVAFIDDDDIVSPFYLSELYEKATPNTISLSCPIAFVGDIKEPVPYEITNEYNKRKDRGVQRFYLCKKFFSGPCMKLIHQNIIAGRRFDPRFKNGEDSLFMFLISDKIEYVDFTTERSVYYRRLRAGSATRKKRKILNVIYNRLSLIKEYTLIYLMHICRYNFYFFITRVAGSIRSMIWIYK